MQRNILTQGLGDMVESARKLWECLGAEPVKHHQPSLLVGPELTQVQPHLGVLSLKGDRDDPL